ncbi:MAG: radical SAM protein [Phaeodactylibacter sp.]|nr:radical SAM protein [Phaeodactylibacter sp.]MCB9289780.1 radical SAM protein [Lewinellaceae bacterium]
MANLSITTICNKTCPYCFAEDSRTQYDKANAFMPEETFDRTLEFLERSGIGQVRLLGGEPTIHPDFIKMVDKALERKFHVLIFSNGLMPRKAIERLAKADPETTTILLNTIHPLEEDPKRMKKQQKTMEILGPRVMLGVNIYSRRQELDYLIPYILDYGLIREIRLGVAHAVLSQKNVFLHPKFYREIGQKILSLHRKARQHDIQIGFDCGFVPCMFPEEELEELGPLLEKTGNCCHPILDLLPDGKFISCYPLNNLHTLSLDDNSHAAELTRQFSEKLEAYNNIGIYPHCTSCPLFQRSYCNGGCTAFKMNRLKNSFAYE